MAPNLSLSVQGHGEFHNPQNIRFAVILHDSVPMTTQKVKMALRVLGFLPDELHLAFKVLYMCLGKRCDAVEGFVFLRVLCDDQLMTGFSF